MAKGIVSAFKVPTAEREVSCTVLSEKGSFAAKFKAEPRIYECVGGGRTIAEGKKIYEKRMKSIVDRADLKSRGRKVISGCRQAYGNPALPMLGDLAKAAESIMRAFISGAPIIVRFHGDGDGVAGAIAIYRALNGLVASGICEQRQVSWQLNKDVVYSKDAFYGDRLLFCSFKSAQRPLLVITDFGTHTGSNEAIAMAQKACDIVWVNHHTLPVGFDPGKASLYINPFNYGSDSRLSAGLTSSIIAQIIGAQCTDLMEAALISDHSACADYSNAQARKAALVIDYMITRRDSDSSTLRKIEAVIGDRHQLEETYSKVGGMLDEALGAGAKVARKYKTPEGIDVYTIDFRKIKDGEYPPPGRFASEMHYRIEDLTGRPAITAVYYGNFISIRVSKSISAKIGLIGIIDKMKEESLGEVGGGGHMEAASLKAGNYETTNVLRMLLDNLKAIG